MTKTTPDDRQGIAQQCPERGRYICLKENVYSCADGLVTAKISCTDDTK